MPSSISRDHPRCQCIERDTILAIPYTTRCQRRSVTARWDWIRWREGEPSIEKVFFGSPAVLSITVNLRKNKCSIDQAVKKKNKCKHLNDAGDVVGLPRVDKDKTYVRNLSVLRKNKRSDKSNSGKSNPANMIFSLHHCRPNNRFVGIGTISTKLTDHAWSYKY